MVSSTSGNIAGAFGALLPTCVSSFSIYFFPFYLHACGLLLTTTDCWCSPPDKAVLCVCAGRTEAEAEEGSNYSSFLNVGHCQGEVKLVYGIEEKICGYVLGKRDAVCKPCLCHIAA